LFVFFAKQLNAQGHTIQNYTDENGLPQNSVKSIATDNAGFVWLATENGLVRYDGRQFVLFDKSKSNTKSNRITYFIKDVPNGQLYALTQDWKLIAINNGAVSAVPLDYQEKFNFKNNARESHLFASGTPNILANFFSDVPYIITKKNNYCYKIFKNSISLYHHQELIAVTPFIYSNQWRFFILNDELHYIDDDLNITKFENKSFKRVKLIGDLANSKIKKAGTLYWNLATENLFIGIGNSLFTIEDDEKRGVISSKKILKNIAFEKLGVLSIAMDKSNRTIYMGTSTKGLFVYKEKLFNTLTTKGENLDQVFYAQIPLKDDKVLYSNGDLFDNKKNSITHNLIDNYSGRITIASDANNNIWTEKNKVVYQIAPDLKTIISNYRLPNFVSVIYIDNDEKIWIGAEKGIYEFDKTANKFFKNTILSGIERISFLKRNKEILWIGTNSGLFCYDIINKKIRIISELSNKDIRSILSRDKEIWITTYGDGFYVFKNNKLIRLPNDKNNYLNTSHCILEDKNGFFWISTNKGLFKAAIADLLAYANQKIKTIYYAYYNKSSGLNTNEFNGGCQPCGSILNNGNFTFPSMNGIVLFNPSKLIIENPNKPIYIDKIDLDGKELIHDKEKLSISNKFGRLNIYLSTPYFGNQENLSFEYKLANENIWIQSNNQIISFSFLPAGKNIVKIRKQNGFGINNYAYKNIVFIVPPYFYQTWWFIMAAVAFIFFCSYFYVKIRTAIIRARNKQLQISINESTLELQNIIKAFEFSEKRLEHQSYFQTRLIGAITHDIKSPLKYLMMIGEALYKNDSKVQDKEGIKAIMDSSAQIYHFTENLVQYAKGFTNNDLNTKQTFNFYILVEEKIAIFKPIAKTQNTSIKNEIDKEELIKTNKHLLSVILHNLLDNAVKFTYAGKISISLIKIDFGFTIIIKDSGVGMSPNQLAWCNNKEDSLQQTTSIESELSDNGLGLIMVKELNKIIGSVIYVRATEGEGTTFEITLTDL
jgi:signal transduction histidine kinase/ligand-binding sensor domain-containing protein